MQSSGKTSSASASTATGPVQDNPCVGLRRHGGRNDRHRLQLSGLVIAGTPRTTAAIASDFARANLASAIYAERLDAAPDATTKLIEFKVITGSRKKHQFVEAGGWATMREQTSLACRSVQGCTTALAT
ncbi:hypothetical protein GA0061102_103736 [Rhizobium miluonense]|uniref:Uncharacterized protein n=1 Tax=Rhizobium miluonense TaxID=411945 RepID=A0A1C3WR91_9HYPH|nr:hypothetical protein GA0061102_103736 [Rhizobium miluonense]